jgi:hypothetical protein
VALASRWLLGCFLSHGGCHGQNQEIGIPFDRIEPFWPGRNLRLFSVRRGHHLRGHGCRLAQLVPSKCSINVSVAACLGDASGVEKPTPKRAGKSILFKHPQRQTGQRMAGASWRPRRCARRVEVLHRMLFAQCARCREGCAGGFRVNTG